MMEMLQEHLCPSSPHICDGPQKKICGLITQPLLFGDGRLSTTRITIKISKSDYKLAPQGCLKGGTEGQNKLKLEKGG